MNPADNARKSSLHSDQSDNHAVPATSLKQHYQRQKNEALSLLTGSITHDLNNVLASILGFSDLALKRSNADTDPKQHNYIAEVKQAGIRAKELVSQLQSYCRPNTHNRTATHSADCLTQAIEQIRPKLSGTVNLSVSLAEHLPQLQLDPEQITQALEHILINSLEAVENAGHIVIKLATQAAIQTTCASCHQEFSGAYIEISIQDDGVGISDSAQERLFDPFFSDWAQQSGHKKRAGMGLAIAHGIVHAHQGHLLLDSSTAQGCCTRVLLPIQTETETRPEAAIETASSNPAAIGIETGTEQTAPISAGSSPSHCVMVVDDEISISKFFNDLLSARGYQVEVFNDSSEALKSFQQTPERYQLLITDQTMPGLTGLELISQIRAQHSDLPVIMCTGYSDQIDKSSAAALGIEFLPKPLVNFNHLVQLANRLTGSAKS